MINPVILKKKKKRFLYLCVVCSGAMLFTIFYIVFYFLFGKKKIKMSLCRHTRRAFSRPSMLYSHTTVTNECQCTCEPREPPTTCSFLVSYIKITLWILDLKKAYHFSVLWIASRIHIIELSKFFKLKKANPMA